MGPASFLDPIPDPQCSQLKGIKMHWTLHASPCSRAMVVPCRSYTSSLSMGVSSSSTWMVKENTLPKKKRDSFGVIPWHQLWDLALSQFLSQEVTCVVIAVSAHMPLISGEQPWKVISMVGAVIQHPTQARASETWGHPDYWAVLAEQRCYWDQLGATPPPSLHVFLLFHFKWLQAVIPCLLEWRLKWKTSVKRLKMKGRAEPSRLTEVTHSSCHLPSLEADPGGPWTPLAVVKLQISKN